MNTEGTIADVISKSLLENTHEWTFNEFSAENTKRQTRIYTLGGRDGIRVSAPADLDLSNELKGYIWDAYQIALKQYAILTYSA